MKLEEKLLGLEETFAEVDAEAAFLRVGDDSAYSILIQGGSVPREKLMIIRMNVYSRRNHILPKD